MDVIRELDVAQVQQWTLICWLIAAVPGMVACIPVKALDPLRRSFWPIIRRGKLLRSSEPAGPGLLKYTVPQSYFAHFYIVGLASNTLLFFTAFGFACKCSNGVENQFQSVVAQLTGSAMTQTLSDAYAVPVLGKYGREAWRLAFLLLLMEIHLTRRLYECLFVSEFEPSARMTVVGYLMALGFYAILPTTLFIQGFTDQSYADAFRVFVSQKLRQRGQDFLDAAQEAPDVFELIRYLGKIGWMPYIGAGLCFYGAHHQYVCHEILATLRADDEPGTCKNYYVPRGDWFELVSCPHYLAEIVIYTGLLVASGGSHPVMYVILGFVVANLYLLAKPTHEWYLAKFDDYPRSRRALFPYFA